MDSAGSLADDVKELREALDKVGAMVAKNISAVRSFSNMTEFEVAVTREVTEYVGFVTDAEGNLYVQVEDMEIKITPEQGREVARRLARWYGLIDDAADPGTD